MAATLKDVAELAGVSIATVSRVLNDPEKVAEGSRLKVMAAVEKLGYSSNLLAKSLRQDGLNAVYVLLPSLSDPYFAQMHQAISDVLFSYGYLMLSAATEGSLELEQECLAKVRSLNPSRRFDVHRPPHRSRGLVVLPHRGPHAVSLREPARGREKEHDRSLH